MTIAERNGSPLSIVQQQTRVNPQSGPDRRQKVGRPNPFISDIAPLPVTATEQLSAENSTSRQQRSVHARPVIAARIGIEDRGTDRTLR